MAVYVPLANSLTPRANSAGLTHHPEILAGTVTSDRHAEVTGWHTHDLDQLEYSLRGSVQLETGDSRYLLPPQQAVWIPAGTSHQTTVGPKVEIVSAFFQPGTVRSDGSVRVLAASLLLREMLGYATRWPIDRADHDDPAGVTFFSALANVVSEAADDTTALRLPTSRDPLVAAAIAETEVQMPDATLAGVARAVGTSTRTLRRNFASETGVTWSAYVRQSRLLRAMSLLCEPGLSILEIATRVGFQSLSAFTRAFNAHTGETPSAYRRRVSDVAAAVAGSASPSNPYESATR